jgi:F420-dependent oxidoreductase-like protein
MKNLLIGAQISGINPDIADATVLERIAFAEQVGVECAWLTSGPTFADPLVTLGAAAVKTQRIKLGTSVLPTFPRHPFAMVQSALAVDALAPGRLRLGVGPSHKPFMEGMYGIPFERPLEFMREYLEVLRAALYDGKVVHQGKRFTLNAQFAPSKVTLLASALRANAFRLCGELADGAISWMCPLNYLRDVAVPALQEGARSANRKAPPLIGHVPVVVSENAEQVRALAREQFGMYAHIPYYRAMFVDAGFPEVARGELSENFIDELLVHGSAEQVKRRLRILPSYGISELLAMPMLPTGDPEAFARTIRALGELAAE